MVTSNASVWRGSSTRRPAPRASCRARPPPSPGAVVPDLGLLVVEGVGVADHDDLGVGRDHSGAARWTCFGSPVPSRAGPARGRPGSPGDREGHQLRDQRGHRPASMSVRTSTPLGPPRRPGRGRSGRARWPGRARSGRDPSRPRRGPRPDRRGGDRVEPRLVERAAAGDGACGLSPGRGGEVRADLVGRERDRAGREPPTAEGFSSCERRHRRDQLRPTGVVDDRDLGDAEAERGLQRGQRSPRGDRRRPRRPPRVKTPSGPAVGLGRHEQHRAADVARVQRQDGDRRERRSRRGAGGERRRRLEERLEPGCRRIGDGGHGLAGPARPHRLDARRR